MIYINDLPEALRSLLTLFADDLKLHGPIKCCSDQMWQSDVSIIYNWSITWKLLYVLTSLCIYILVPGLKIVCINVDQLILNKSVRLRI